MRSRRADVLRSILSYFQRKALMVLQGSEKTDVLWPLGNLGPRFIMSISIETLVETLESPIPRVLESTRAVLSPEHRRAFCRVVDGTRSAL